MIPARHRTQRLLAAPPANPKPVVVALAAALLWGQPAAAAGLGEPFLLSSLGQPLRVRIPVVLDPGEKLARECISLSGPLATSEMRDQFLTRATVDVSDDGREVLLRTSYAVHAPVILLRLQVNCGRNALSRDYTLLPDPPGATEPPAPVESRAQQAPATAVRAAPREAKWELRPGDTARGIAKATYPDAPALQERLAQAIVRANPERFPDGDPGKPASGGMMVFPDLRTIGAKGVVGSKPMAAGPVTAPGLPVAAVPETPPIPDLKPQPPAIAPAPQRRREPGPDKRSVPAIAAGRSEDPQSSLQLSSVDRSLSRRLRLSDDERKLLQELQQLAADDQMSRILELKQRVADMEAQFEAVRTRFERTAGGAPAPSPVTAAPGDAEPELSLPWLGAGLGAALLLALLAARRHLRPAQGEQPRGEAAARRPEHGPEQAAAPRPVMEPSSAKDVPAPEKKPEPRGVDSILEEAQRLMIHGHPLRAIKLLEEQIGNSGGDVRLWMLLFVLLRSQNMTKEFAEVMPKFKATGPDPELWENIQALGHEMDPGNPLYHNGSSRHPPPASGTGDVAGTDTETIELNGPWAEPDRDPNEDRKRSEDEPISLDLEIPPLHPRDEPGAKKPPG